MDASCPLSSTVDTDRESPSIDQNKAKKLTLMHVECFRYTHCLLQQYFAFDLTWPLKMHYPLMSFARQPTVSVICKQNSQSVVSSSMSDVARD